MRTNQTAPLFIVKVPRLNAPLQAVITFHYNSVGQTPTFTNGGGRTDSIIANNRKYGYLNIYLHFLNQN